jgi:uncharacterized membrane protein
MKKVSLYIMGLFYMAAGVNHFIHPAFYKEIMPARIAFHDEAIFISGICEVLFALLLLFPSTRRPAAWAITGLLIVVFPANIQMMLNYYHENNPGLWFALLRLPLQIVLIWWAYLFTKPLSSNKA